MVSSTKYSKLDRQGIPGGEHRKLQHDDTDEGDFELSTLSEGSPEIFQDNEGVDIIQKADASLEDSEKAKRRIQLWRLENLAVPLCYFTVGLLQGLIYPLINVYPLDLGATEAQQTTIWFLKSFPTCLKILFGFLSDSVPIFGYRRKPYIFLGWMIAIASMLVLLLTSDLSLERVASGESITGSEEVVPPVNAPSVLFLSFIFFIWAIGIWWADVIADSLVAEKCKYETDADRGNLQVCCYALRGFGMAVTIPISSFTYSTHYGPWYIIMASATIPIFHLPFLYHLQETRVLVPEFSPREQLQQLWKTACSRVVWQPMLFVFTYGVFSVSNAAWREFLKSRLGFTANQLNSLLFFGGALSVLGVAVYKFILIRWSWRTIFIIGVIFNGVFSLLQILLIRGQTFGLDPFLFSLGDEGVMDFLLGTQFIPLAVMMVNLVPPGIEGASYALFTTTFNAAVGVASGLSTILLGIWDVSKETLTAGDLSGMTKLTFLTTAIQVTPLLLVRLVPHSVSDLEQLKTGGLQSSSTLGGSVYLVCVFLSIIFALFIAIMNVVSPGWIGES